MVNFDELSIFVLVLRMEQRILAEFLQQNKAPLQQEIVFDWFYFNFLT